MYVYLAPFIEKLQRLWKGVMATDGSVLEKASSSERSIYSTNPNFNLRANLMWSIQDFLAYGLLAGQVTKGYRGCSPCVNEEVQVVGEEHLPRSTHSRFAWIYMMPTYGRICGPYRGENQEASLCHKPHMCSQRTRMRHLWMLCGN